MSREIGTTLPAALRDFLSRSGDAERFRRNQVIPFTTVDDDGWPRHGMLSPWEVVARDQERILLLVYASSRSCANLRRDGRVTFLVVNPMMSYYIFGRAVERPPIPEAPGCALFEVGVQRVVEDVLPTARIQTALTFEGFDPGMVPEAREKAFLALLHYDTTEGLWNDGHS